MTFSYDRGGRQASVTDAAGEHARTFTVAGEMKTDRVQGGVLDGVQTSVAYDPFLRRDFLQASRGATVLMSQTYGYDSSSRSQTITSGSQTATYAYHPNGLLNTTSHAGGMSVARSYDQIGRLASITTSTSSSTLTSYGYTYNNLHQRTRVTREDGSYWLYSYNDRGEVMSGKRYWADNTLVWGQQGEYAYDNIGNRNATRAGGNALNQMRQASYSTNNLNQYTGRSVPGAVDVAGTAHSSATVSVNNEATARKGDYFYKELAVDNGAAAVSASINVIGARQNYGAGGEDAVTERGGRVLVARAQESYSYDLDGNLSADGLWTYRWDAENRLISMESLTGVVVEARQKLDFSYDYMGRRIEKRVSGFNVGTGTYQLQSVTKFVYDGWNLVAELDTNFALVRSYVWGQDVSGTLQGAGGVGGLLAINEAGQSYQAGYDGNGNLTTLVKAGANTVAASYEYDAFGNTLKAVGEYASRNPFQFSTKFTDGETGLLYYGYRYYQPQTGRWLSRDPMEEEGGQNLYAFLANAPVDQIDPLGLLPKSTWVKIALDAIKFQDMEHPGILLRNRRITAAYGRMFKRKPSVYVWAGLATFASNRVGIAMNLATLSLFAAASPSAQVITALGIGNFYVYRDMMWQHEAYDSGGIREMEELKNNRELDPRLYEAWCYVSEGEKFGNSNLIFRGAALMAKYEQEVVLQDVIKDYQNIMARVTAFVESPIPGDPITFRKHRPNGSFSNPGDRVSYAVDHLIPTWQKRLAKDPNEIMGFIDELISRGQK